MALRTSSGLSAYCMSTTGIFLASDLREMARINAPLMEAKVVDCQFEIEIATGHNPRRTVSLNQSFAAPSDLHHAISVTVVGPSP
jgi:hypothetical protein